jgi:flavin-dependent dehydrogenase
MNCDVIMVGTGPAGGMAACILAGSGLKVVILEKSHLPRHKPCGGALSYSVLNLIDWDISPLIEAEIVQQVILNNYELPIAISKSKKSPMSLVSRNRFDAHFIERALGVASTLPLPTPDSGSQGAGRAINILISRIVAAA